MSDCKPGESECLTHGQWLTHCQAGVAALEAALAEAKARARPHKHGVVPMSECDLCQGELDPAGGDWQWVEEGWSLACLKCLARIRLPLEQALAERTRERDKFKKQGDERRCDSCLEVHPMDCICPPHEVRTTGQAWFGERWKHLIAERTEDRAAIRALDEVILPGLKAPSGVRLCACPPSNPAQGNCWYCKIRAVLLEHAAAIQRATEGK